MLIAGFAAYKLFGLTVVIGSGYGVIRYRRNQVYKKDLQHIPLSKSPLQSGFRKSKSRLLDSFSGNSRESHQAALQNEEIKQLNEAEQAAKRDLKWMSLSLGFATVGLIGYPFFFIPSSIFPLYHLIIFSRMAYRDLIDKHKVSDRAVASLIMALCLVKGFFFALPFGTFFVLLIRYLTIKTEDQSFKKLTKLFGEQPRQVWVLVNGVEVEVPFENLHPGDIIIAHTGQMIPVDGTIIEGTASIDQHMLTGEAQPIEKTIGEPVLYATIVLSGKLHIRAKQTGEDTVAAQVVNVLNKTIDFRETLQSRAQTFVDQMTLPTIILSGITWVSIGASQAMGVLVVYPGYRLLFLNPLSMLSFLHTTSQHNILIKDGRSLELLNDVDMVVFDKTGTLTLEQLQVRQVYCCSTLNENEILQLASAAEATQTHPIAQAILEETIQRNLDFLPFEEAEYKISFGVQISLNGQVIRVGSLRFMAEEKINIPSEIEKEQNRCHERGFSFVMVAMDNTLIGAIELEPTIRPEVPAMISQLKARNLNIVIISGDHEAPTRHLAEQLGVDQYFAEVLPTEKANLVEQLERQGHKVCFVGDGINDSIALKKATVSISLRGATSIATDTAQVVLMDGTLDKLVRLFEFAKSYQNNIRINFLTTMSSAALYVAGAYIFSWGFMTSIILHQGTSALALFNVARPLLAKSDQKQNTTKLVD